MSRDIAVVGAGIVGLSIALQLQHRGWQVQLWDQQPAGEGTSFGNAGLIQREAVIPHPFPRNWHELWRYAGNRHSRVQYQFRALPQLAPSFLGYWRASRPDRLQQSAHAYGALIRHCLEDHMALAAVADARGLYRSGGWVQLFRDPEQWEQELAQAAYKHEHFDVDYMPWDAEAIQQQLPMLETPLAGAIHWTQPLALVEPLALSKAYLQAFQALGGEFRCAPIIAMERQGAQWSLHSEEERGSVPTLVLAMGAWTGDWAAKLGYRAPVFVKRGYHQHYAEGAAGRLPLPVLDSDGGYVLAPMRQGLRLTTGAEFAHRDAPPSVRPLQLAEAAARQLYSNLGAPLSAHPWLGHRPCTADMLPIIGFLPQQPGVLLAFGHCHQGLTMGPSTGRLVAEMLEDPAACFVDPRPYRPERFTQ